MIQAEAFLLIVCPTIDNAHIYDDQIELFMGMCYVTVTQRS